MNTPTAPVSSPRNPGSPVLAAAEPRPQWVPVKRLSPHWQPAIEAHLLGLSEHDRYLRFGVYASDTLVRQYVSGLRFERDDIVGVFNRKLELVAAAHLAIDPASVEGVAEYGISVSAHLRGMGYGKRLFAHAVLMARNRGLRALKIHALTENTAMLQIARQAGATVVREGGDAHATLTLPAPSAGSRWELWLEEWAGDVDFHFKRRTRQAGKADLP
jgi:GNAT superfamily N-acetyltransferase